MNRWGLSVRDFLSKFSSQWPHQSLDFRLYLVLLLLFDKIMNLFKVGRMWVTTLQLHHAQFMSHCCTSTWVWLLLLSAMAQLHLELGDLLGVPVAQTRRLNLLWCFIFRTEQKWSSRRLNLICSAVKTETVQLDYLGFVFIFFLIEVHLHSEEWLSALKIGTHTNNLTQTKLTHNSWTAAGNLL